MSEFKYLYPNDVLIRTYNIKSSGAWSNESGVAVEVTHIPTGLSVKSENMSSKHRNKHFAMTRLNKLVENTSIRFVVVREYSGVTAKNLLWKVYSLPMRNKFDAENWKEFCEEEEPKHKGKFFVVRTGESK